MRFDSRRALTAALVAAAALLPRQASAADAPATEGYVPPGYHVELKIDDGLVFGGSLTLGLAYLFSVGMAVTTARDGGAWGAVPLFGSFVAAGTTSPPPCKGSDCSGAGDGFLTAMGVVFGAVQLVGVTLTVLGVTHRKKNLVQNYALVVLPAPMTGPTSAAGAGLVMAGRF